MTTDKARITIYMDEDLKERLQRIAAREKRSFSNLIEVSMELIANQRELSVGG